MMINNNIKLRISIILLFLSSTIFGQGEATSPSQSGIYQWMLDNIFLVMGGAIILGAFFTLLSLVNKLLDLQKIRLLDEHGKAAIEEIKLSNEQSSWSSIINNLQGWKPIEKEADILIDHDYDGIRELDNNLPPWWLYMFYACILFAAFYLYLYQFSDIGISQEEEYNIEMVQAEEQKAIILSRQSNSVNESNAVLLTDAESLAQGKAIYDKNCLACHAPEGQGMVGPNLTDEYWNNGGGIKNIFTTIKYGVPEKGMIAWQAQLNPSDIHTVASFIISLEGTNPPNPKAPEGEIYTPEEEQ